MPGLLRRCAAPAGTIERVKGPRRLYVLRHAKSSWDDESLPDHERPLSERGQRATALLARYVREHNIQPELILCSSARRTRETLEGVSPPGTALIEHRLYGATSDDLLERLREVPADLRSVMLVGHNPALQMLVLRLADREAPGRSPEAEGLEDIRRKLPTGALVTLEFDDPWAELEHRSAELVDYVRPRALQF